MTDTRAEQLLCPELRPVSVEHRNPWFSVCNRGGFYTVESNQPQVAVLVVVDKSSVVLVKVKRPVIGDMTWELPAGACEPGESLAEGAVRELLEEAGIAVAPERLRPIHTLSICPNRYPRMPGIFRVDISQSEYLQRDSHDEEIEAVELVKLADIKRMLIDGSIYVALPALVLSRLLLEERL